MTRFIALLMLGAATAVSAQTKDNAPVALESSTMMVQDKPDSESWTYIKPGLQLSKYNSILIKPTTVYSGPDAQFDGIKAEDRTKFADMVTTALGTELPKSFHVVRSAGPRTIALQVIILGAKKTKGGVATATRVTTVGFATSALKSIAGKPGTLTGSLLVAVEFNDSKTGELLAAAVRRRTPDALDIPATLSTTDTVNSVARDLAKTLREKLVKAKMSGQPGR